MLKSSGNSGAGDSCSHDAIQSSVRAALETNRPRRERGAAMLRALADPQRLAIVELLSQSELCVSEIAEIVGAGPSTVSERLRVLRTEGIVATRREGKHIFYYLSDRHIVDLTSNLFQHAEEIH